MKQAPELLTIGETMATLIPTVDNPALFQLSIAGAESNVAIGAATLGIRTAWISRVGTDHLGAHVVESIGSRDVDVTRVEWDRDHRTGLMLKYASTPESRVYYYRADSAASRLSARQIIHTPAPRIVHTSGITSALSDSAMALTRVILGGHFQTAMTSFDVNYRSVLWRSAADAAHTLRELASQADIVFVGRDEAERLWGSSHADDVRALLPAVSHLIVKDAEFEAVEFTDTGVTRAPSPHVDVVEPVGAGDAFAAGWIAALLRGESAEVRLRLGHACAAQVLATRLDTLCDTPPYLSTLDPTTWRTAYE